ncbi:hypothetical protein [Protaetiibacter mangrovi]|uniref:Uncharacterized protein n=1 Tax=Protaetiibacter mangrovi TaxID=2970926 RepID=A0ABT1ZC99_9MICO|nr:hypothetical protein [Protaetiibacter mangrovi]MCS0498328.1 hypothetical protein [Protaetiibacter mangrovi]TPX02376.1 hypothetical protein FJ656_22685 [Schumannella luteola]
MSAGELPHAGAITAWRAVVAAVGVVLLLAGVGFFLTDVRPADYPGVVSWLLGAIVLHDGLAAMAVFVVTVVVRRTRGIPFAVLAVVQSAVAAAVIVTVVVAPEIVKQAIGTANPSILPLDYARNLLIVHAGIAIVAAVTIAVILAVRRRATRAAR